MATSIIGTSLLYGIQKEIRPLIGLPPDCTRLRVRMRSGEFVKVFAKTRRGIDLYCVENTEAGWKASVKSACNKRAFTGYIDLRKLKPRVQKFSRLSFVSISSYMPPHMAHFGKGCDAIISGTYAELHGSGNILRNWQQYKVYLIDPKSKKITNTSAWYDEDQLSFKSSQDQDLAEGMIYEYLSKGLVIPYP